jgi:hypothetical protein
MYTFLRYSVVIQYIYEMCLADFFMEEVFLHTRSFHGQRQMPLNVVPLISFSCLTAVATTSSST